MAGGYKRLAERDPRGNHAGRCGYSRSCHFDGGLDLVAGERHAGCSGLQRRLRLFQLDLVRPGIDDEEKVTLVDDLSVLEMDFGKRSADLGP